MGYNPDGPPGSENDPIAAQMDAAIARNRRQFRWELILNAPPVPEAAALRRGDFGYETTSQERRKRLAERAAQWAIAYADAVLAQLDAETT